MILYLDEEDGKWKKVGPAEPQRIIRDGPLYSSKVTAVIDIDEETVDISVAEDGTLTMRGKGGNVDRKAS